MYIYDIPHFYIIWKILKNPIVGRPICAGYNWILTPASIFVDHFLKEFYSKFENILTDSLSLVKILGISKFDKESFLFTIDFKSLYTNISVTDAMELMKRLFFKYQNMIPNAQLILELMDIVLKGAVMKFQEKFFMQILGIVMGTNLAPILANIYMAMLEEELQIICIRKNITWPKMFKRFIDDGFGVINCNKKQFSRWVEEFNNLRENVFIDKWVFGNQVAFMDLYIYKGKEFHINGKLSIKVYQKPENKYMYIPYKSAHPRHTIKNYILGELKRYVRIKTEELNFLKMKNKFFLRLRNRGFEKKKLSRWFSEVRYSLRTKYLGANPGNICYFQGTRETGADPLLVKISEDILKEATSGAPEDSTEVVSEDEGVTTIEDIVCQEVSFSKGIAKRVSTYSIDTVSNKKLKSSLICPTVSLLTQKQNREKLCCIFPGSMLEYSKEIKSIMAAETATLLSHSNMRRVFKNINIMAVFKNKSSLKNLVVKTKI